MKLKTFFEALSIPSGVTDMAFPHTVPCPCLLLAAVSRQGVSRMLERTLGFASLHPRQGCCHSCLLWTHRMVRPLGDHHFHPQIQRPSLCTQAEEHPRPFPLQNGFAFQHQDSLHKQEGKNLAWGTKCHKYMCYFSG